MFMRIFSTVEMPVPEPPAARGSREVARDVLAIVALSGALFALAALGRPLWCPDEGRYAEIPREMVATGDWVTPRLDGVKYLEKPPLLYWMSAVSISVLGRNDIAYRLPTWLFGILGCVLVYGAGRRFYGRAAGRLAALVLATSPLYWWLSGFLVIDMVVSVAMTGTLLAFLLASREPDPRRQRALLAGMYFAAALATLAKGLIGILLPGLVVLVWTVLTKAWPFVRRALSLWGIGLFLLVAVPWHVVAEVRNPGFANFYFIHEQILRFSTTVHDRTGPWWYFVPVLAFGMLPWIALLPRTARAVWIEWRARAAGYEVELFLTLWAALIFLFFSASQSKLPTYVLPVWPPLALLFARQLARLVAAGGRARAEGVTLATAGALLALLFVLLPVLAPRIPALAKVMTDVGDAEVAAARAAALSLAAGLAAMGLGALILTRPASGRTPVALGAGAVAFLLGAAALHPALDERNAVPPIARELAARLQPGDLVISYCDFRYDLMVSLERLIPIAACVGELKQGSEMEDVSHLMISDDDTWRLWHGPQRVWLVTRDMYRQRLKERGGIDAEPRVWSGNRFLIVNRPPA
jgi:4-amino-4-deoxy-L-arabinose transferase-like glycosyltransferase